MDLDAGLRRTEAVAQRRHLMDGLGDLDRVVGAGNSEASQGDSYPWDRGGVLHAEHELVGFLVVIGEDGTSKRKHGRRRMLEPRGEPILLPLDRQAWIGRRSGGRRRVSASGDQGGAREKRNV